VQNHEFINFDDNLYIHDNPNIKNGLTLQSIKWAFTNFYAGFWFPITWLSHIVDYTLYGLNPKGHHFNNLLFHVLNSILLFLIFYRTTGKLWRSSFVAALFALHPLNVEPVAWISSRKDVLSTFFWMLTIWLYIFYTKRPNLKRYISVLVSFIFGLMSKPMVMTLPFVLILLDYWPLERLKINRFSIDYSPQIQSTCTKGIAPKAIHLVYEKMPLLALSVIASLIAYYAEKKVGALPSLSSYPFDIRLANAMVSYAGYISKMFWPFHLAIYYPHPGMPQWPQIITALLILFPASFFAVKSYKTHPYFLVGWLWYLGALIPVIGLVQIGAHAMADRYTYVPLIGLFIILAWGIPELIKHQPHRNVILSISGAIFILFSMATTWKQVQYWKNGITIFRHALAETKDNYLMHYDLGYELNLKGKLDEASYHFSEAIRIKPDYEDAHNNLGVILAQGNNMDEAISHFLKVLEKNPNNTHAWDNLEVALSQLNEINEKISFMLQAENIRSDHPETYYNLGVMLENHGKFEMAVSHFSKAILMRPDYAEAYYNLGLVLSLQGNNKEAANKYSKAIQLKPDYKEAQHNLQIIKEIMGVDCQNMDFNRYNDF